MPKKEFNLNPKYYQFIANGNKNVVEALKIALHYISHTRKPPKWEAHFTTDPVEYLNFLDVGCGTGNIMQLVQGHFLARQDGERNFIVNTAGIEYNPNLSVFHGRNRIHTMDALEFKHYGEYDIIYYYSPILDHVLQSQLEEIIEEQVKSGSVILAFLKISRKNRSSKDFIWLSDFMNLPYSCEILVRR